MKFYTWKDIERFFYINKERWNSFFYRVEVYPDSIVLYKHEKIDNDTIVNLLQELFFSNFEKGIDSWNIHLDIENDSLNIELVEDSIIRMDYDVKPLFKEILYRKSSYPEVKLDKLNCPVIAFHSYKGGVGRTLSLLAFAKAWSEIFTGQNKKLLIVDSDIEAPGLTWLNKEYIDEDSFSYFDLLDALQDASDIKSVVALAKSKMYGSSIMVHTDKQTVNQFFLPTYRYKEQLLDVYATPDTIVNSRGKKYALADTLSQLGDSLGAAAVLVDLRAGLSDYSATLLFDIRVKKYLVTSTSEQSVKGTELLLDFLSRGLKIDNDAILPEIFLNMVVGNLNNTPELSQIIERLKKNYDKEDQDENDRFVDNFLTQLPFASELIHLSSLEQIFHVLSDRAMFNIIKKLVKARYDDRMDEDVYTPEDRHVVLNNIHKLASSQITAENASEFKVLMTKPLQFLIQKYSASVPQTIITGAKGAGKTFLYMQMVREKSWDAFCRKIQSDVKLTDYETYFLPVLTSQMFSGIKKTLEECIFNCKRKVSSVTVDGTISIDNVKKVKGFKEETRSEFEWIKFWENVLAKTINPAFSTLQEANQSLQKENKKVILLIDGLEELFVDVRKDKNEGIAISSLCKDVVNQLVAKYQYIGIIIFLRHDMALDAISINFAQFMSIYEKFSLRWSQEEALRLALWLVKQAHPSFLDDSIDLVTASREVIEQNLIRLWGLKLGKNSSNEAYTSRWILAALSDFNGQLQARDIIRFLKYATQDNMVGKKMPYDDRFIMPQDVRDAVIECSNEKIKEIEQEYRNLTPIFEKLRNQSSKTLPLMDENIPLNIQEQQSLEMAGFLKKVNDKYYMPEIIRHALGYRYERGARPKVLSLLLRT